MTRAAKREGMDIVALEALQPGVELSRQQMKTILQLDGGDLSRLMERLVRRGWLTARREKPNGFGRPQVLYKRADGEMPQKPKRAPPKNPRPPRTVAMPLPKVIERVKRKAEPLSELRKVCSVWDLGAE